MPRMDPIVLQAMAKWPQVPSVYGWLALDRRGNWSIKGERLTNPAMTAFINRNYASDEQGRWFFQNGPQRVFVALAYTPFVFRTAADRSSTLLMHTGSAADAVSGAWLDENGALVLKAAQGVGVLHDQDLPAAASLFTDAHGVRLADEVLERLADGEVLRGIRLQLGAHVIPLERIASTEVAARFSFDAAPHPAPGEPEC